ncbi:putative serine/threonine protein kinase [Mycolicibacterium rhodesiae JS60]|nr:putative serine/threonine protein kinase [Mycolicibacterium rhodesiae JS60]
MLQRRRTPLPIWVPLTVVTSAVVVAASLAVTTLSAFGVAGALPPALRAAVGVVAVLTMPGLPIAALLRLPTNGVFAAVGVSLSLAVNILAAQLNYAGGLHQPYATQYAVSAIGVVATAALGRQWYRERQTVTVAGVLRWVRRGVAPTGVRWLSVTLLVAVAALFVSAVRRLDVEAAGSLGLFGVLGVDYYAGLALLCVVLVIEYRRAVLDRAVVATSNVVLIAYITMPVAWSMGTAPFVTAYVHRMITNWLIDGGALPPPVDARISWAGFFSAAANLITTTGLHDSAILLVSASLVMGICLMFPVYAIGLAITGSRRVGWLGVTVLTLFNWYQQDYFAPQAVAMLFNATLLAVLLWQLRASNIPALAGSRLKRTATAWRRIPGRVTGRDGSWTLAVEMILVVILAAMVVAHQLTPLAAIVVLLIISAAGLTRYKLLWLAAFVIFIGWFRYGAAAYWQGHLGQVIADIGGVDQNLNSSVSQKITGDPTYRDLQLLRIGSALLLMALAGIGWLRLRRLPRSRPWLIAALALSPFVLVMLQSYGGEVAIRAFLYASPVLSPLAAMCVLPLLRPRARSAGVRRLMAVAAGCVLLVTALLVTANRGLNISFERTKPHELAIASELVAKIHDAGLGYWGQGALYGVPRNFELADSCFESAEELATCTAQPDVEYFSNTEQDENFVRLSMGATPAMTRRALELLRTEKGYQTVYDSGGVLVLKRPSAPNIKLGGN